jgi:transposase
VSIVDWVLTIMSIGFAYVVLSFPYLIEKSARLIKNFGVDDE